MSEVLAANTRLTAQMRLEQVSKKSRIVLRQLFEAGQLCEESLEDVLNAAELAGRSEHLLGFAIGYLHMRWKGVPVSDVIRMARAQHRRIRLNWSVRRWKEEHERLSRAETLNRLAAENVHYSTERFAVHLPQHWNGYLICSSRRLGMEGLRQRHCVASYHDLLKNGSSAIACVFVGRQRWTVQLHLTGNPEVPLGIMQIKTRFNVPPAPQIRRIIHEMLGIAEPKAADMAEYVPRTRFYMENLRRILPVLRELQVGEVRVTFDGSGDSGSIEDVSFGDAGLDEMIARVEVLEAQQHFENGSWVSRQLNATQRLPEAIRRLTEDYLEETGVDWYNNDGGFGSLLIDVNAGTVNLEVNCRYTESSTEYDRTRDIVTGEEV